MRAVLAGERAVEPQLVGAVQKIHGLAARGAAAAIHAGERHVGIHLLDPQGQLRAAHLRCEPVLLDAQHVIEVILGLLVGEQEDRRHRFLGQADRAQVGFGNAAIPQGVAQQRGADGILGIHAVGEAEVVVDLGRPRAVDPPRMGASREVRSGGSEFRRNHGSLDSPARGPDQFS